ncbi:hypothetical protein N7520_009559 [Penicillium odoratum]|uniref:uncharacterized protein n=1 Tax=Penicillium odoratum TaxID=1167516 RepID=UPI0025469A1E|nr:uncharacterized protein N7520_009559 [Penicillium odoratum]KAJ5752642.1 hypothetical protein N7520_009559 [Penicillium odoratum]
MRLLHHFATHTAATLSDHPEAQIIWRTSVVECSFRHPFLLQGILAVAALHTATSNPQEEDRLSMMAASKQNTALKEFRTQLQQITPKNCDALFAFSFLAGYYVPASAGTVINPSASFLKEDLFNAMVYWLRLCRGTSSIYQYAKEWIKQGPLANLFWTNQYSDKDRSSEVRDDYSLHTPYEQRLSDLETMCNQLSGREEVASETVVEERELNTHALKIFLRLFCCLNTLASKKPRSTFPDADMPSKPNSVNSTGKSPSDLTLSLAWLFEIPLGFIDLLEQQRPVSLVIFAHFAILLLHAPQFWWNEPIARKIVKTVNDSLAPRYHRLIQWPIHEVLQRSH